MCRKSITVIFAGTTITVPVEDKGPTCDSTHIDLSRPAFEHPLPRAHRRELRFHPTGQPVSYSSSTAVQLPAW
ncbi:RlpA-like double-psi beta-barrel domain-containing protein [Amycolatopsis sp. PS_44_ISF1]|uniref:RlpA-like double-psi beta-barrel domain-containing protein n=1 Tax=Amycolatopsis sp. PS_44_ISF1 TaxID=2974917 RepID=UPI0028DECFC1|nr:RlpA-like double-psi beta-barrel domain-containing protein [Amycolatopsis sp. PS_44_ISF1]MDT8915208.1 RlpA-like double-psi beta-barrel domain-containing protein [Amycolatopsis sp. PS_44_ISF1]